MILDAPGKGAWVESDDEDYSSIPHNQGWLLQKGASTRRKTMGYYHNKAEQDYAESDGTYFDPPRDPVTAPFWSDEDVDDWEDYKAGWENAKNQDRG